MSKPFGLSTSRAATETFTRNYPHVHHFLESPINSQRPLPSVTCVSEREFSCVLCRRQPSASWSSVRGCASLNGASTTSHVIHTATPRFLLRGHIISGARPHMSASQPSPRPLAGAIRSVPYSFHPNDAVQVASHMPGVQIGVDKQQQQKVDDSPLSRNRWVDEDMHLLTPGILHDADILLSITPNILDGSAFYNENWSLWDMIRFNGILIDESEIMCQWAGPRSACNECVRVKNIKIHLAYKHGVKSNSQLYRCSWNECSVNKPMERASLARHVRERRSFVKWACPTCDETFTRDSTLLRHFKSCPGRSELQAYLQH